MLKPGFNEAVKRICASAFRKRRLTLRKRSQQIFCLLKHPLLGSHISVPLPEMLFPRQQKLFEHEDDGFSSHKAAVSELDRK